MHLLLSSQCCLLTLESLQVRGMPQSLIARKPLMQSTTTTAYFSQEGFPLLGRASPQSDIRHYPYLSHRHGQPQQYASSFREAVHDLRGRPVRRQAR